MEKTVEQAVKFELKKRFKRAVLEYAKHFGVKESCDEFEVPKSTFFCWKNKYDTEGESGLDRKKPIAYSHPKKTSPDIIKKIIELRNEYKLGSLRIT